MPCSRLRPGPCFPSCWKGDFSHPDTSSATGVSRSATVKPGHEAGRPANSPGWRSASCYRVRNVWLYWRIHHPVITLSWPFDAASLETQSWPACIGLSRPKASRNRVEHHRDRQVLSGLQLSRRALSERSEAGNACKGQRRTTSALSSAFIQLGLGTTSNAGRGSTHVSEWSSGASCVCCSLGPPANVTHAVSATYCTTWSDLLQVSREWKLQPDTTRNTV